MDIIDFVLKVDDAIPESFCDELINIFDESSERCRLDRSGYPNWENLFVSKLPQEDFDRINKLIDGVNTKILVAYQRFLGEYGLYFNSSSFEWETANIKRYVAMSDDRYDFHADVSSGDVSRRYLAFLWYLNDDFVGGETVFYPDHVITPRKGSILVFPPFWLFPHSGKRLIEGQKYIMSSYALWDVKR